MVKEVVVGSENFSDFIRNNWCFVDKTGFVAKFINTSSNTAVVTRPSGWGKTLNL